MLPTILRGVGRLSGTLAGVLVATVVMHVIHPTPALMIALILASAWLGYAVFQVNYAAYALALTLYVVFSLVATGLPEPAVGNSRILSTAAGALFAILAYLAWPMWQSKQVRAVLRESALAQRRYGDLVLALFSGGSSAEVNERSVARALRVRAESLVEAAEMEPHWGRRHGMGNAHETLVQIDTNAAVLLSFHALALGQQRGRRRRPRGQERYEVFHQQSRPTLPRHSGPIIFRKIRRTSI